MLDIEVNKLLSIFFCYKFVLASFDQLNDSFLAKDFVIDGERSLKNVLKWSLILVVENILETLRNFWLPKLEILYIGMLS